MSQREVAKSSASEALSPAPHPSSARAPSTLSPEIERAIASLLSSDPGALEILVRRYGPGLHRFLFHRTRNAAVAEDLFQEVWHQVLISHTRLRNPERFPSWLYGIAKNLCRASGRRRMRETPLGALRPTPAIEEEENPPEPDFPDPKAPDPRERAQSASLRGRIDSLLSELNETTREMIRMRFFDNLTTGQIAEVLDVPLGTVCSTVHRGLLKLREALRREGLTLEDLS